MQNPWDEMRSLIVDDMRDILTVSGVAPKEVRLEAPNKEGFGDFAFACFELAKAQNRSPVDVANELVGKFDILGISVKAIGPYVNFYVNWTVWADKILSDVGTKYGFAKSAKRTAVVDFSSPNPAHPFHMGTVRSTIMGEAVSRILKSQGYGVKRLCYVNDLGRQASVALLGYMTYAEGQKPKGKEDVWLGQLYFKANAAVEGSPVMQERVEQILRECEKGTPGYADLGRRVIDWCLSGFEKDWKMMDIKFDKLVFESQFVKRSKEIAAELKAKELTLDSEGAVVLNLEPHGLPSTILLRSDGTALYLARDIAFALWRYEQWRPERNIYVVAEDQRLHFQQLFKTLELLGYGEIAKKSYHLSYSMVLLEGRKMSSRAGRVVLWDELLDEGVKKIGEHMAPQADDPEWKSKLKAEWKKLPEAKRLERAQVNVLAAIKYFILRYAPEKPVDFHWDVALALEGDTGPYIQYTYARAGSILKKATKIKAVKIEKTASSEIADESKAVSVNLQATASDKSGSGKLYSDVREQSLLRMIAMYPDVLRRAAEDMRPHYVAGYLFNLADTFNTFYEAFPVLRTDAKTRAARMKIVKAVKQILASGLELLAIEAPEKM